MNYVLDLDGTLVDSEQRHGLLMEQLLREKCEIADFDKASFLQYKTDGNSGKNYLTNIMKLDSTIADRIMTEWQLQIENPEWILLDHLYPDTIPFLQKLEKDNIIYLSARQNKQMLIDELHRLSIFDYASAVFVVSPKNAKQEKKNVVLSLCKKSSDFVIVGDTENEYNLALELNLPAFLLNRGARNKNFWEKLGVTSFDNLLDIYTKMSVFPLQNGSVCNTL